MANSNSPRGLVPYAYAWGAPYNGAGRVYYVPVGNGTALYIGDPVAMVTASSDGNGVGVAEIASAGTGDFLIGSFVGICNSAGELVIPLLQSQTPYLAAAQAAYILVADDPNLLYWIQESGNMGSAAPGGGANLLAGSGSTVTSLSGWQLNSASLVHGGETFGTPSTWEQLRVMQALQQTDNSIGANAKWLVKINTHQQTYQVSL